MIRLESRVKETVDKTLNLQEPSDISRRVIRTPVLEAPGSDGSCHSLSARGMEKITYTEFAVLACRNR